MEIQRALWQFITTTFYPGDNFVLNECTSLLDSGLIDSTGVLELISFIEREFGITVEDTEIVPENLDSLGRLAAFVARKQAALGPREHARA
ncbi:acyl carrier protein [Hyalangium rubrum]|uniref:Acyl carrier protein n=1 Tax=Hyalangium rubrum TaxID=3103134 RepID=A0ABU5HF29_9BACT|nr:acyl carrier protein [Hyalangium sp. s54d21]MDY7231856.1 acyl carrier protein [Hyalangium sp. s54d21]